MSADYSIAIDRPRNLLDIRMSGFFHLEDVRRYRDAVQAATAELGGDPGRQRMINDITGMNIQAQDIVAAFADHMTDPRYVARRVAFVVEGTLARKQLERAVGSRDACLFRDRAAAERWLFAGDAAAAA